MTNWNDSTGRCSHICLSQGKHGGCQLIVWKNQGCGSRSKGKRSVLFSMRDGPTGRGGRAALPDGLLRAALIPKGSRDKLPPTGWLKTREIDSLAVPEAASRKSRGRRARLPMTAPGPPFSLFQPLVAPGVPWLVPASLPFLLCPHTASPLCF